MLVDIGANIRKTRIQKKLTVSDLANNSGLTSGYISQVERNIVNPSVNTLKKISDVLNVPLASFFIEDRVSIEIEDNYVVRKNNRKTMVNPQLKTEISLLSPSLDQQLELIMIKAEPGGKSGDEFYTHEGEECGIILQGSLTIEMLDKKFELEEGDSITFKSSTPHKWFNSGAGTSVSIWAITPPSF